MERGPEAGDQVAGPELPDPSAAWPGISEAERARRAGVLAAIARRMAEDAPRVALASPERGRQFIPFAALRGYDDLLAQTMRQVREEDRRHGSAGCGSAGCSSGGSGNAGIGDPDGTP